jgi:hypothetical protein
MNLSHRRLIAFAGSLVAIDYEGRSAAAIVDFLFQAAPPLEAQPRREPQIVLSLHAPASTDELILYRDSGLIYQGNSPASCAELLLGEACHWLAFYSSGGMVFHAAAVAHNGRGVLLPGNSGAGKTSLAAWLAVHGFDYLTDELVWVPQDSQELRSFTRPLNFKLAARPLWEAWYQTTSAEVWTGPQGDLVMPAVFNSARHLDAPQIDLIIFPSYTSDAAFTLQPLTKAQAGLQLLQCLVNARNVPEYGLPAVAQLARHAPAYRLNYASFDPLAPHIQALVDSIQEPQ